ncbi:DUF1295 domain-containing protein [Candidatus Nomurabacteria bacterium]|nr:DUF1295 domain-containing protein [Candidatus Nomurabacteria bacterium]
MIDYFVFLAVLLFAYMNFWFVVSVVKKRNDVADIAWGMGFVLLAWISLLTVEMQLRSIIVTLLVSIWGIRLSVHIYKRNREKKEDYRYQQWRREWGRWFYLRSYLQVYLLQGCLLFIVAFPVLVINRGEGGDFGILDLVGILVWMIGFFFEAVGDWQLARFVRNPDNRGKLITTGLWQYSRHPNYFGEVTQWWGIWLMSLSGWLGWYSIIGPLTITFLILKVSGVPMLEKRMEKKPSFSEYKKKVSMFFPLPPKK